MSFYSLSSIPAGFVRAPGQALILFVLALSAVSMPAASQEVEPAVAAAELWLAGEQSANGSYGAVDELRPRDTARVVIALAGRAPSDQQVTRGAIYLSGVPEANAEFRALRVLALSDSGRPAPTLNDSLLTFVSSAGLGAFIGHGANLYDSAIALQALGTEEERFLLELSSLVDFVQLHQGIDGGWGFLPEAVSELYYSSEMLFALASLDRLSIGSSVLDGAASFLLARQQPDGGFGGVLETAVAFRALIAADRQSAGYPYGSPVPYLLARQAADGSWSQDVFTTAQVVRVLRHQRPNLLIQEIVAPTSSAPGVPVSVSVTVRNAGADAAASSRIEIRGGSEDGELLAEAEIAVLADGEEATVELEIATEGYEGSLDLFAVADAAETVDEVDEDDNVSSFRVTLRAGPDLALFGEDLTLSVDPPQPEEAFELLVSVRNLGETDVPELDYEVARLVDGVASEVLVAGTAGPVAAGAGALVPVSLTLEEGEHTLVVVLDPSHRLDEESEANNHASMTFFVVDGDLADLAIAEDDLVLAPSEPVGGEMVDVSVTVHNLGDRDASSELILVESSSRAGAGDGVELRRIAVSLPAGASETVTESLPLSVGAFGITATVDPDGAVAESDESNNRVRRVFRDLPDLAIGFDNFEVLTPQPEAGDPVTLQLTVRNAGTLAADDVRVEVFAGDPAAGGQSIFSIVFSEIPVAGNRSTSLTWTATAGLQTLVAVADPEEGIIELSESNNRLAREIAVPRASGPDLEITAIDRTALAESANDLTISGFVTLDLFNGGDQPVDEPFLVRLFEDRNGDGRYDSSDGALSVTTVDRPVAVGETISVMAAVDGSMSFLHSLVWAEVDSSDVLAEIREDNNRADLWGACSQPAPTPVPSIALEVMEEWSLGDLEIESAPIVVQLTDDNGDQRIDSRDIPDVVFHTTDAEGSAIVAVSGLDGSRHWTFRATAAHPILGFLGQAAAADLDGDGIAEVIGHQSNGRLLALRHDGELLWVSDAVPGIGSRGLGGPAVGDLDADGVPEIAYGRAVVSNTGRLIAVGTGNTGQNYNYYGLFGTVLPPGVGSYPQSIIADIDLDGRNELVAGDTVYRLDGSELGIVWNATVPDKLMVDGFSAVANLDGDPEAEIVYVSSNQIMVLNHDGSTFAGRREMLPFYWWEIPSYWGGPPTVADLNGDGTPEILVVTSRQVIAYTAGLGRLWQRPILGDFGGFHTATAFDLDGDGVREVMVLGETSGNDALTFFVLDGATGATRYSRPNISKTAMEFPVVVDVDGDGRAEILVPSNTSFGGDSSTRGLHVLGHPSWRWTRPIWNQYGYHVTNVALDGTVPSPQRPPWTAHNIYRANRELSPPAEVLKANASISFPRVGAAGSVGVPVTVRVGNGGLAALPAGVRVELFDAADAAGLPVVVGATDRGLRPGQWQDVVLSWTAPSAGDLPVLAVIDREGRVEECDEGDNEVAFVLTESLLPDLSIPAGGVAAPSSVSAGQLVDVAVRVQNVGNAISKPAVVRFYDGPPSAGDVLGQVSLEPLQGGAEAEIVFTWDTFGGSGLRLIHVVVDPERVNLERELENNEALVAVELEPSTLPDLTIESVRVIPEAVDAGVAVLLEAQVRNLGARAEGGFEVLFRANNSEIGRSSTPGALDAGEATTLQLQLETGSYAGTVSLSAIVDPRGRIDEGNEGNNEATGVLEVRRRTLTAAVSTDRLSYQPEEPIAIQATLTNSGSTDREIELVVRMVDSLGAVAAQIDARTLLLTAGQSSVLGLEASSAAHPAGSYAIVAELFESGTSSSAATAFFTIAAEKAAAATLLTDRDVYAPLQAAVLEGTIFNHSANDTLFDATARLAVSTTQGAEVFALERAVVALYPSSSVPFNGVWEIANAAPGAYTASLGLRDVSSKLVAYAETPIRVESSSETGAGLEGRLSLPYERIALGAPFVVDFEISNEGNEDVDDLRLRFDLVRTSDGSLVDHRIREFSLIRGASASGSVGFPTQGLLEGGYLVSMVAVLPSRDTRLDRIALTLDSGISVFDATIDEGDSGTRQLLFPVRLSSPQESQVEVGFTTVDGSAKAGSDYVSVSGTLSFDVGEVEKAVAVTVFGDLESEVEETLLVVLTAPAGVEIGDGTALGVLVDEEGCASPDLLLDGDGELVGEGEVLVGWGEGVGFERRFATPPPLSGAAYLAVAQGVESGEASQIVDLTPYAAVIDASVPVFVVDGFVQVAEGDAARLVVEYLDASGTPLASYDSGELSGSGGWSSVSDQRVVPIGTRAARVLISGNGTSVEPPSFDRLTLRSAGVLTLTLDGTTVFEGDSGVAAARLPLRLSCATTEPLHVDVITADDTARAGSDFNSLATTLVVPAGQRELDVLAEVVGETLDEEDEIFLVVASAADAIVLDPLATVIIHDDDGPVSIGVDDLSVTEGDGASVATVTVGLSSPSGKTVSVAFETGSGTATAGVDYSSRSGRLTFPAGTTEATIDIPIQGDTLDEADETLEIVLSGPVAASLGDALATVSLLDDDVVEFAIDDVTVVEGDPDGSGAVVAHAVFTVSLSLPSVFPTAVSFATADGLAADPALADSDYLPVDGTLSFLPAELGATVTVPILADLFREAEETFRVVLSAPTGGVLGDPEGEGLIVDDDGILISVGDAEATEPPGFPTNLARMYGATPTPSSNWQNNTTYAGYAVDGRLDTSWFPYQNDAVNRGGSPYMEVTLAAPARVVGLRLYGSRNHPNGYDYFSGYFTLYDEGGAVLWESADLALPAPDRDIVLEFPAISGARRARFTSTGDESDHPGLSELEVIGFSDYRNLSLDPGTTAAAISIYSNSYLPANALDGSLGTYWHSRPGDAANRGGESWYEVHFQGPATVEEIRFHSRPGQEYLGGIFQLFGWDGAVLWDSGVVQLSGANHGPIAMPTVEGAVRLLFTSTSDVGPNPGIAELQVWGELESSLFVPVTLSKAPITAIQVSYTTVDGSALAGEDYQTAGGTLDFPIASLRRYVGLDLLPDPASEHDETFGVELFDPIEGLLLDAEGEITIRDDDRVVLNGSAETDSIPGCVVLTPDVTYRRGSAWSTDELDLAQSFDKTFRLHLGARGSNAGEGMYFALQDNGRTALGAVHGYTGIAPSVGVQLDTTAGTYDLMALDFDGIHPNGTAPVHMTPNVRDLADGTEHELRVVWNAAHRVFDVELDGEPRISHERDLVGEIFDGDSSVLWGFTAETAGRRDLQYFCPTDGWCAPGVTPLVSVGNVMRREGDPATGPTVMSFPVTLSCPSDQVVTVDFATLDQTARAGADYVDASGQVVFQPGETAKQVEVEVLSDLEWEVTETYLLQLSSAVGADLQHDEAVGTIEADDWGAGVMDEHLVEGDLSRSYYFLPVDLFVVPTEQVRLNYQIVSGTATANSDFVPRNSYLTFNAGQRIAHLRLDVIGDAVVEGEETLHIDFSSPTGLLAPYRVTLTLIDDDECPSPNLLVNGDGEVLIDGELAGWTEVVGNLWTSYRRAGTPDASTNHIFPGTGLVPFAELRQDVDVSHYSRVIDAGEQFFVFQGHMWGRHSSTTRIAVEYRDAAGTVLESSDSDEFGDGGWWKAVGDARVAPAGTRSVRVRLFATDHDTGWNEGYFDALSFRSLRYPSVLLDDVSIEEGDVSEGSMLVPVRLSCAGSVPIELQYLTVDGTAVAGSDYRATAGSLTIPAGALGATIGVKVIGDTVVEGDEVFSLRAHSPVEAAIGDGEAVLRIVEDESRMSIADVQGVETSQGEIYTNFVVTLDRASEADITARYQTSDGTATAGEDYRQTSGTVRFFAGSTEETITVTVFGDTAEETDETFFVRLSQPNNVEITDGEAVGTIIQDDIAISAHNATVLEGNVASTFVTFEVELATPSSTTVTTEWGTVEATATEGEDYEGASGTLTFLPGQTRLTFPVTVYGDDLREGSETFFVRLSNPVNGQLRIAEGTGIIIDDDDCPSPNLLRNPSGEIPVSSGVVPFWTEVGTTSWTDRTSSPAPIDGLRYLASGGGTAIELYQEISVATYADYIDAGLQRFSFEGFVRSRVETVPDLARVLVEYRDEEGGVIEVLDSGDIASTSVWQPVGDLRLAPVGTRSIRVRLLGRRASSSGGVEVYFDGLGLRSVGTPVLLPSDVELTEGDEGSVEAVFAVDLLCPSDERTITLDYATRDRSAVAESDYVPVQGSMIFRPGEANQVVAVETLGDFKREVSESFYLDFSNVVNAVVLYPYATGTLIDDDPGNAPVPPSFGSDVIYTLDQDFELGYLVSVQHDDAADDQLQLSKVGSTFPFIWIAASSRGTIVKIDTRSGEILGEFSTSPDNRWSNPSRTTVMLDGSVWVTNRDGRSIAHVGLEELNQCVDRDGNGTIETSGGYGDVLLWRNAQGEDTAGGVTTAEDECILHYVPTTASGTRHISIRDESSIWVSGTSGRQFDLVDTHTGQILSTEPAAGCGGYGGLTDPSGVVWSSNPGWLLRWDPSVIPPTAESKRCISAGAYGVAVDSKGWIWVAQGSQVRKISPDGKTILGPFPHGNPGSQGLAVDGNDHVWVSSSLGGGHTSIGHLDNDGLLLGTVFGVPDGPTGISVDSRGYIWSANYTASSASRIDPTKGPLGADGVTPVGEVDLVVPLPGAYPYNYSDMTGFVALQATSRRGTWSVIQDAGAAGAEWGELTWNSEPGGSVPEGAVLVVEVRIADTVIGLGPLPWLPVESGVRFEAYGRFLQARVTLQPNAAGDSPVLSDLRIALPDEGEVSIGDGDVTEGTGGTTPVEVVVSLAEATLREVVASFTTVDGTSGSSALAGLDYVAQTGTVVFEPGQTEAIVVVEVIADDLVEETEIFEIELSDAFNGVLLDSVGVVTILDDDLLTLPDLYASKIDALLVDADADGVPSPGDTLQYTIAVENAGNGEASGVVLRDLAPTYTELVLGSVTTDTGLVQTEVPIEVDLGTLAAGTTATIGFQVVIDDPFPLNVDTISNQATVVSTELPTVLSDDPDVGGELDPTVTMVTAAPRLVAEKSDALIADADGDGVPSPGDTLEYTVRLRNLGNTAATGVAFGDTTPEHTSYVAGSAVTSAGTVDREDPLEVVIGELEVGTEVTINLRVQIENPLAIGVSQVENQGLILADGLDYLLTDDPEVGGEADPTITEITAAPVLTVEKADTLFVDGNEDGIANPGEELLYRLEIESAGNTGATQVILEDSLPPHTSLVAGTLQTDTGTVVAEEPITIELGSMVPGTSAVVTFRVVVDDPFPYDVTEVANQAIVRSAGLDPVVSDDPETEPVGDPTVTAVLTPVELSVDDVVVSEGDDGAVDAVFTVSLSNPTSQPVGLRYVTGSSGDSAATAGGDYLSLDASLTIAPGETSATLTVTVIGDLMDESDETFTVTLSEVVGATVVDGLGVGTILDDDAPPMVFISDVAVSEGDPSTDAGGGIVPAAFVVSLDRASGFDVTVSYRTLDGSALAILDYQTTTGTVLIPAGQTATPMLVAVLPDLLDEPDETFTVQLSDVQNALVGDPLATGTIRDNDLPPTVSIAGASVVEGDAGTNPAELAVTLSAASGFAVEVAYAAWPATAEAGVDYLQATGNLTVPIGETSVALPVAVVGDLVDELDETFTVTLSSPVHAVLGIIDATATILDDDEALVRIDDVTVEEGDEGTVEALFTVRLELESDRRVTVDYRTAPETAMEGGDYLGVTGTLDFPAGTTETPLPVAVMGDRVLESDETFRVELLAATETTIADETGVGTILDDEICAGPNLLRNPGAELRPEDGLLPFWSDVPPVSFERLRDGLPAPVEGRATFFAGLEELAEVYQDVDVAAYAPRIALGDQRFAFHGFVRTADEIPPDVVRIVVEYRDATNTVVLAAFDSGEIISPFEWLAVADERLAPVGTGWIRVRLLATRFAGSDNDGFFDALSLRSLRTATVTVDDVTLYEGDAGSRDAVFTVALSCAWEHEVSLRYSTADGTALADADYLARTGELTFPVGTTELPVAVPVVGDTVDEPRETFDLVLSDLASAGPAVFLDPLGLGTILEDDFCPRSHGYWKTHRELWPVDWLEMGGVEYEADAMMAFLEYQGSETSSKLMLQLVATKLNLVRGGDPSILPVVEEADAFLELYPPGTDTRGEIRQLGVAIKDELDAYNNTSCPDDGGGGGGGGGGSGGGGGGGNGNGKD